MRAYCRACPVATSAPAGVGLRTGSTRADGYSASAQGLLHAPAYSYVRHAATSGYGVVILVVPVAGLQSGTSLRRRTLCSSLSVAFCNGLWFLRAGSEGNNRRSRCRPARLWGYAGGYGGSASDAGRGVSRRIPANGIFACLQFWFRTPGGGTTPLIARVLIDASGVTLVPAFYLMFGAFLAMSLYFMPDRRREPLL